MKWIWKKTRMIALVLCAVLVVNMNTNIIPSFATDADSGVATVSVGDVSQVSTGDESTSTTPGTAGETVGVSVQGNSGTLYVTYSDGAYETDIFSGDYDVHSTLAEEGICIYDPVSYDSSAFFSYWQVDGYDEEGNCVYTGTCTTEEMLNYPLEYYLTSFIAQYEYVETASVYVECYDYIFSIDNNGVFETNSYGGSYPVGSTLADAGITVYEPVPDSSAVTFDNWKVMVLQTATDGYGYQEYVEIGTCTTEEMLSYPLSYSDMKFVAQFDYSGAVQISIQVYDGVVSVAQNCETVETSYFTGYVNLGSTLTEAGINVSDPVYNKTYIEFDSWQISEYRSGVDEYGCEYSYYEAVDECTTEELLVYPFYNENTLVSSIQDYSGAAQVFIEVPYGEMSITENGITNSTSYWQGIYELGSTLADAEVQISDPVINEELVEFDCWAVRVLRNYTDEYGNECGVYEEIGTCTTEELMSYPLTENTMYITASLDYSNVCRLQINGGNGSFTVTTEEDSYSTYGYSDSLQIGTTLSAAGITISNPVCDDEMGEFVGWEVCKYISSTDANGTPSCTTEVLGVCTTEELADYPLTEMEMQINAQWEFPEYVTVHISGAEGTYTYTQNEYENTTDFNWFSMYEGTLIGENITTLSDAEYWNPDREFLGWKVSTYEEVTDENGNTYEQYVQLPGTGNMTSEEVLALEIPQTSMMLIEAQWAGEDSDYYSEVSISAYDGMFTYVENEWEDTVTSRWFNLKEGMGGLAVQYPGFEIKEVSKEGATFEGWLEFKLVSSRYTLVSETLYTTEQILNKEIPEYDVVYTAKWSDIAVEDYYVNNYWNLIVVPEGGTIYSAHADGSGAVNNATHGWPISWGIGCRETVGESLAKNGSYFKGAFKVNAQLQGWKLYTADFISWYDVVSGSNGDIDASKIFYRETDLYTSDGISYDRIYYAESYELLDGVYTVEQINALTADRYYLAVPVWTEYADLNAPVLEDFAVSYDADRNVIVFEVTGYDADSDYWRGSIGLYGEDGRYHYSHIDYTEENHVTVEHSARRMVNGTYTVSYIELYDPSGNRMYKSFSSGEKEVEVTNSPYIYPVVVEGVYASKESVSVSKDRTEDVTITVKLERGKDVLTQDTNNNNRVGYIAYHHSDYIDLYMDEAGNITGVYPVDWLVPSGTQSASVMSLYITEEIEEGYTSTGYQSFDFYNCDNRGAFEVVSDVNWNGEINNGPIHVENFTIVNKSTGEELENGTFFNVADGKTYTLEFTFALDADVPEGARLQLAFDSTLNYSNTQWVTLEKQANGLYTGELVIDAGYQCTQYVAQSMYLFRGYSGHSCPLKYEYQPFFNVINGTNFAVNTTEVTFHVYGDNNGTEIYTDTVLIEGRNMSTLEELLGGAEAYAALVAQTEREDGLTCDKWSTGSWSGAQCYGPEDVLQFYSGQMDFYLYPSYTYTDVTPFFCYYDENGYYQRVQGEVVRVERGTTVGQFFNMLKEEGMVPQVPNQGEHEFIGWETEVNDWVQDSYISGSSYHFYPCYDARIYDVYTRLIMENGEYEFKRKILFPTEDMTVGDLLDTWPAPEEVPGYTFVRWEILEGSRVYLGGEEVNGVWTPIYGDWEEDMLLTFYGVPSLQAVYEREEGSDSDEPVTTPEPTIAPAPIVTEEPAPAPVVSAVPELTATPEPTIAPTPVATAEPTVVPAPVVTAGPTVTAVPELTETPEPTATAAPVLQVRPVPATTPEPTEAPAEEPIGVVLSEMLITEAVTQIADIIASADTSVETPAIVLDMTTETGEMATVVPVEILETIQGQNVDVVLDMGGYSWTINGNDIKAANLAAINLEVTVNADAIPSRMVEALSGGAQATQLSLTHEGDFGFKASLSVNLGAENAGQFGNMYYYDSDGRLVFMNAGQIDEQGNVSLSFSHASDYVVIVGEEVVAEEGAVYVEADGTLASAKEEITPAEPEKQPEESKVPAEPEKSEEALKEAAADSGAVVTNGGNMLPIILVVVIVLVVAVAVIAVIMKKRDEK